MSKPSKADIELIVNERFPYLVLYQTLAAVETAQKQQGIRKPTNATTPSASEMLAKASALQMELEARPADEVAALAAHSRARNAAKAAAQRAAKEAQRFYNRPSARADFALWCKADFWTPDEAAALLLGRDPRIVNPETLAAELNKVQGMFSLQSRPKAAEFHHQFNGLRTLLQRSRALHGPELTPSAAVAWAIQTQAVTVPSELATAVKAAALPSLPIVEAEPSSPSGDAAAGRAIKWTPAKLEELRAYRERHGTLAAAAEFGISDTRIRQLLPKAKSKAPAKMASPFDVLMPRAK